MRTVHIERKCENVKQFLNDESKAKYGLMSSDAV